MSLVELLVDLAPFVEELFEFFVEISYFLAFGGCAHDNAEIFGANGFHQDLESLTFFLAADLFGDGNGIAEGGEYDKPSGDGDLAA